MQKININGKEYPCYETCGASIRFKEMAGKDVSKMEDSVDLITFLYCKTKAACARERIDFDMSLQEFADNVLVEDIVEDVAAEAPDSKKK